MFDRCALEFDVRVSSQIFVESEKFDQSQRFFEILSQHVHFRLTRRFGMGGGVESREGVVRG